MKNKWEFHNEYWGKCDLEELSNDVSVSVWKKFLSRLSAPIVRLSWWCEKLSHLLFVVNTISGCPHYVITLCVRRQSWSQTCASVSWDVSLNGSLITEWLWLPLLSSSIKAALNSVWIQLMNIKKENEKISYVSDLVWWNLNWHGCIIWM